MKRILILPGAQRDLADAVAFYRAQNEQLVVQFVAAIQHHLEIIGSHPERGPLAVGTRGPTEFRRLKVLGFPFGILYRLRDNTVEVAAVAHERRKPGYWLHR